VPAKRNVSSLDDCTSAARERNRQSLRGLPRDGQWFRAEAVGHEPVDDGAAIGCDRALVGRRFYRKGIAALRQAVNINAPERCGCQQGMPF